MFCMSKYIYIARSLITINVWGFLLFFNEVEADSCQSISLSHTEQTACLYQFFCLCCTCAAFTWWLYTISSCPSWLDMHYSSSRWHLSSKSDSMSSTTLPFVLALVAPQTFAVPHSFSKKAIHAQHFLTSIFLPLLVAIGFFWSWLMQTDCQTD